MKIKCLNKAVDAINLPALLRSTSVTDKIPVYFKDSEPLIVAYKYTSTTASKLFKFAPTLSKLNVSYRLFYPQTCQCKESKICNWKATETMFLQSIDLYKQNWPKREQVELKYLSEWENQLKELVADRISSLKGHFKSPKIQSSQSTWCQRHPQWITCQLCFGPCRQSSQ